MSSRFHSLALLHELVAKIGGFIWDWVDQGLVRYDTSSSGQHYFVYGGDHDDPIHDGNFCINGLTLPDSHHHLVDEQLASADRIKRTLLTHGLCFVALTSHLI